MKELLWFVLFVVVVICAVMVVVTTTHKLEVPERTVLIVYDMEFFDAAGYADTVAVVSWVTMDGRYNALQVNDKVKAMRLYERLKELE